MQLNNKVYDVLKWLGLVCLPAVAWFIGQVGADIGIPNPETVVRIINAVATLLGMLLGVSCYNYGKGGDPMEEVVIEEDEDGGRG